jgi:GntR family transcriptional regulator
MRQRPQAAAREFAFRLDAHSGVPVYRQLIDQVLGAVATGVLRTGGQLPTVRLVAVDLAINPNTVMRAYREMEIRGILDTQQEQGLSSRSKKPLRRKRSGNGNWPSWRASLFQGPVCWG